MREQPELYYSYSNYLKDKYGEKVYKLPVNLPVSCPNRLHGSGCTFCAAQGTGFEAEGNGTGVKQQLERLRIKIENRYHAHKFIAYFQNYTNTFLPLDRLMRYMTEAAQVRDIVEIAVSTRPDCISEDYLRAFKEFHDHYGTEICLEYGLQTVNYHTLLEMNRGHGLAEYIDAVLRTARFSLPVCTHLILNLPGDTIEDVRESARVISALPVKMVKLHSLYIPENSPLAQPYLEGRLRVCGREDYLMRAAEFVALLRPDIVVERLFSRIPEKDALFCNWGCSWWKLMDEWKSLMNEKGWTQGSCCDYLNGHGLKQIP